LDIDQVKEYYEWQKSNTNVRSLAMELKEELCSTGSTFVWRKQECNLGEITKIVKDVIILKVKMLSYHLFSFCKSVRDYIIHMDMEIVIFVGLKR